MTAHATEPIVHAHAPDHPLVARLRTGDQSAVAAVYDRFAPRVLAYATSILGNRHQAEDVVQDSFVALVRSRDQLVATSEPELEAWLLRTARNRCLDLVRSARFRRERPSADLPEHAAATSPGRREAFDPVLVEALGRLPERQRTALVLRRVLDLDGEAAGEVMGLDREAVYALSAKAEKKLRRWLQPTRTTSEQREAGR